MLTIHIFVSLILKTCFPQLPILTGKPLSASLSGLPQPYFRQIWEPESAQYHNRISIVPGPGPNKRREGDAVAFVAGNSIYQLRGCLGCKLSRAKPGLPRLLTTVHRIYHKRTPTGVSQDADEYHMEGTPSTLVSTDRIPIL